MTVGSPRTAGVVAMWSKESHPGAEQHCGEVDLEVVDQSRVEQPLDRVGAVDAHGPLTGGVLGLAHRALDAVRHEVDGRPGPGPPVRDVVSDDEGRAPRVVAAPALGDLEG